MLQNHIKVAFRTLSFYRKEGIINILGLSAGIAISIILLIHVNFELKYDKGFPNYDHIYRVKTIGNLAGKNFNSALTPYPLAAYLTDQENIAHTVRLIKGANKLVSYDTLKFNEDQFFYADEDFFNVFQIPIVNGNSKDPLKKEEDVVLTKETAERYFGTTNPIGKRLKLDNGIELIVSAICESAPQNSHFNFDFIASTKSINQLYKRNVKVILNKKYNNWLALDWYTYVLFKENVNVGDFEKKAFKKLEFNINSQIKDLNLGVFQAEESNIHFRLQAIEDIHWQKNMDGMLKMPGQKMYIFLFVFIAAFVLIATCVNFMYLTTANASHRLNEIVIRKSFGVTKSGLFIQLLIEAIVYSFIALLLSMVLVELLLPVVSKLLGFNISFNLLHSGWLILYIVIITFGVGVISGLYPAYVFSKIPVINIFQEKIQFKKMSVYARGILFLVQMFTLTCLCLVAVAMAWQLNFLKSYDRGYNADNILVVERGYAIGQHAELVKQQLKNIAGVEVVSSSMALPGEKHPLNSFTYESNSGKKVALMSVNFVDENYLALFHINLDGGRFYRHSHNDNLNQVVVNQRAVDALGIKQPLAQSFYALGNDSISKHPYTVVGVIKDYLYEGVKYSSAPLMLLPIPDNDYFDYLLIRVNSDYQKDEIVEKIREVWIDNTDEAPFEYTWLSDNNVKELANEVMVNKIIALFVIVALVVSVIGLRAYASFVYEFAQNDMSIKRELGANPKNIIMDLFMLMNPYLSIGILLAIPASFIFIQYWVSRFVLYNRIPVVLLVVIGLIIWLLAFVQILILLKQKLQKT